MTRAQLTASLTMWAARERFRLARWRHHVKTKRRGHPLRSKWFNLYVEARDMRKRRQRQISRLPITHIDAEGRQHIMREEGVRNEPYNDSAGHCTVGVGHLIHHGNCTAADHKKFTLSDKEVEAVLARDLRRFERAVRRVFKGAKLKPNQAMFNACVSLAFNIGEGGFLGSTVAKRIKAGDKRGAADAFLMWDKPPELIPRRRRERAMFLS